MTQLLASLGLRARSLVHLKAGKFLELQGKKNSLY